MTQVSANQLRVGNFFNAKILKDEADHFVIISEISEEKVCLKLPTRVITRIENLQPIPLTEEWLLKFGFTEGEQRGYYPPLFTFSYTHVLVKSKIEIERLDEKTWMWLEGNTNVHIYYVHQLQNLIFAITGKDLTINTPA